jgi:hypothetical protein
VRQQQVIQCNAGNSDGKADGISDGKADIKSDD